MFGECDLKCAKNGKDTKFKFKQLKSRKVGGREFAIFFTSYNFYNLLCTGLLFR